MAWLKDVMSDPVASAFVHDMTDKLMLFGMLGAGVGLLTAGVKEGGHELIATAVGALVMKMRGSK